MLIEISVLEAPSSTAPPYPAFKAIHNLAYFIDLRYLPPSQHNFFSVPVFWACHILSQYHSFSPSFRSCVFSLLLPVKRWIIAQCSNIQVLSPSSVLADLFTSLWSLVVVNHCSTDILNFFQLVLQCTYRNIFKSSYWASLVYSPILNVGCAGVNEIDNVLGYRV